VHTTVASLGLRAGAFISCRQTHQDGGLHSQARDPIIGTFGSLRGLQSTPELLPTALKASSSRNRALLHYIRHIRHVCLYSGSRDAAPSCRSQVVRNHSECFNLGLPCTFRIQEERCSASLGPFWRSAFWPSVQASACARVGLLRFH